MTTIQGASLLAPTMDPSSGIVSPVRIVGLFVRLVQRHAFPILGLLCALCISNSVLGEDDVEKGALEFSKCYACHSLGEEATASGAKAPNLAGIVGAPVAAQESFPYTEAMREFAREHPVWTEEVLDEFLAWPGKVVPGTSMDVSGIYSEEDRRGIIAYLKSTKP